MGGYQHFGNNNNTGSGNMSVANGGDQTMNATTHQAGSPERAAQERPAPVPADRERSVFVVHGRDMQTRDRMFSLLRQLDLRPLEWEDLIKGTGGGSPFVGDVVAKAPSLAQAALVLLTPDDVAKLHPQLLGEDEPDDETVLTGQPRQNVLLELGMVLMAYPERTIIVEAGKLRHVGDTAGRNVIRFNGRNTATAVGKVVVRLKEAGCRINDTGSDWRQIEEFTDLAAYRRRA